MTPLSTLPCIFLSYQEPNADANYQHLLDTHPVPDNVRRVHGVRGFDTAHKMAALVAWAPKFIMFDGDTRAIIPDDFYRLTLEAVDMRADDSDGTSLCFSSAVSTLCTADQTAGLAYGNGGIKIWSRKRVLGMLTHENAEVGNATTQVEFCYEPWYRHSNWTYSVTVVNTSAGQAFRAGLREGYKLSEFYGVQEQDRMNTVLTAWMTMSADVDNGRYSMLGARAGFLLRADPDFDGFRGFDTKRVVNEEQQSQALLERLIGDRHLVADIERLVKSKDDQRFRIRTAEEAEFFKQQHSFK